MSDYRIVDIENFSEKEVKKMALENMEFKGYNIYFVDLKGYFGYSCIVFKNGRQIHYTNDYELHHRGKTREELRDWYINGLQYKLFTSDDLKTVADYHDYENKIQWLMSYFPMEYEYYSAFVIKGTPEEKELELAIHRKHLTYSSVCMCYFKDKELVTKAIELYKTLREAKQKAGESFEYWVEAFKHELYNHEYNINWQGNYDVFSCFGRIEYKGEKMESGAEINDYMNQLNFTDTQRKAWSQAYNEYSKAANY